VQDRNHDTELGRRTIRWGSIAPAWLFFYAFIVLQGLTPFGEAFHGDAVAIAATAKLVSVIHALGPANVDFTGFGIGQPRD
jgi:hypothetical protein